MQIETLNESRCWDFPAGQDFEKYHRSFDEVASTEMLLNEFLFFSEESDFCQEKKKKKHAAIKRLFLLYFKSFQEESFSKLAHLDTTARSMESKKRVLFKESLCIVNRIKGGGKSHLSLSNVSPGHSPVAPTGETGFHIHCSLQNSQPTMGIFSIKQFTDIMCIQQWSLNTHWCTLS